MGACRTPWPARSSAHRGRGPGARPGARGSEWGARGPARHHTGPGQRLRGGGVGTHQARSRPMPGSGNASTRTLAASRGTGGGRQPSGGRCLCGTGTPGEPGTPGEQGADSLPRAGRGQPLQVRGHCDRPPHRGGGEEDWPRGTGGGAAQVASGVPSRGPQTPWDPHARGAAAPRSPPAPRPDRGGGSPVITFPMMLPTSCRKNHRNPTSPAAGAPCPCDAGGRGPQAGRRGCAARPPVWRPCVRGIPLRPSERG